MSKPLEEGWLLAPMLQWQRVWVAPVHTRNQLQLPLAASFGKGKNTERIKQLQAWVFGLYSFFADAEYLHPSPGATSGASPGDWGEEEEDGSLTP